MIRFYNARILTFSGGLKISDGEVHTNGSLIDYVGPAKKSGTVFDEEYDLHGNLIMPGFKNAHAHTAMTFLRSLADDMPLSAWLSEQVWPNEAKLTPDAVYTFTKLGIMEYLSSGITSAYDMYVKNESVAKASVDSGFRMVIGSGLNNFDADPENIEREYLRFNSYNELISYRLGIHAEYTTSVERMEYMAGLLEKYREPCFLHLAETRSETDGCMERYGKTPAALISSLGMFRYGGGGFHCCYMTEDDIRLFADNGLYAVTNPSSNLKLASGIAPVTRLADAGVRLAIGTDGAASNNALDMFREMYLVTALQKYLNMDAAVCDANTVLEMACVGGAGAMGLTDCDDLAEGKKADLVVIDLQRPNMQPLNNISKNIVYSGSKENVLMTVVNGRVLYRTGEFFLDEPAQEIYKRANEFVGSLRK